MTENTERMLLKDRKRADIIAAAVNEFQSNGFSETSMDRIAETADVSKRTVYNHFPSKEDLFQAIIRELVERCGGIDVTYDADSPLNVQLTSMGRQYVETMISDDFMKLARVVLSRFIHSPELAGSTIRGQDESKEAIVRWIQAAKKDGRLQVGNVQRAATQFASLLKAFAFWPQLIGNQEVPSQRELTQTVKSAVGMFLDHYETQRNP